MPFVSLSPLLKKRSRWLRLLIKQQKRILMFDATTTSSLLPKHVPTRKAPLRKLNKKLSCTIPAKNNRPYVLKLCGKNCAPGVIKLYTTNVDGTIRELTT
jgi:hypothetical protein